MFPGLVLGGEQRLRPDYKKCADINQIEVERQHYPSFLKEIISFSRGVVTVSVIHTKVKQMGIMFPLSFLRWNICGTSFRLS